MSKNKEVKNQSEQPSRKSHAVPTTLKGMKDILSSEKKYWDLIGDKFNQIKESYSFDEIETPILENPDLYENIFDTKDSESSNLGVCVLAGKGKSKLSLRPDVRTSILRSILNHNLLEVEKVLKFAYSGQVFSYQKDSNDLQCKRDYVLGFEVIGDRSSAIDAHLIMVAHTLLKELGLKVVLMINSIGDKECRELYNEALSDYFKHHKNKFDNEQKKWLKKEPTKLLGLKNKKYKEIIDGAPQIVDYLSEDCKAHFFGLLEYLDDFNIQYNLDPLLMKDLNYYNRTVFDFCPVKESYTTESSYGGGGRYDNVAEKISGRQIYAGGVSLNIENIVAQLKSQKIEPPKKKKPEIFLAQIAEQARKKAMILFEELRIAGFEAREGFVYNSLKTQLEIASKLQIPYILILGQKEVLDDTIMFRDVEAGIQEVIDLNKIIPELKKRIKLLQVENKKVGKKK